jgi:putative Holliday junction resolvase
MSAQSILTFDFGTTRFGVAIGQTITGTASELPAFPAKDGIPRWEIIDQLVNTWQPDIFLVGIPLNMDGSMSEMGLRADKFRRRLSARYDIESQGFDERLTSFEAKGIALKQGKRNFKQHSVDSLAAKLIFESWYQQ